MGFEWVDAEGNIEDCGFRDLHAIPREGELVTIFRDGKEREFTVQRVTWRIKPEDYEPYTPIEVTVTLKSYD